MINKFMFTEEIYLCEGGIVFHLRKIPNGSLPS